MPMTIESKTAEYEVATPIERDLLVQAFEAATEAHDVALAQALETWGEETRYATEEYQAKQAFLTPTATTLREANAALSACGSLPVGTAVRFSSSAGWSGTDHAEGVIVKITNSVYVVEKSTYSSQKETARLDREHAHKYQSSYGGTRGARSLSVVRTPSQEFAYQAQQREERAKQHAIRSARDAQYAAERDRDAALRLQQDILLQAHNSAVARLIKRYQRDYDAMLLANLDLLSKDVPGREETAPYVAPETA